jgi:lysine 6-dehydrogenase
MKAIVLGSGLVGAPMAKDLAKSGEFEVACVDLDPKALEHLKSEASIREVRADLSRPETVREVVRDSDFVISAVPGRMGFETLRSVIEEGKDVVDIAFFPEDPFLLDDLAKSRGVTAVVDCGVAPGMSNILVGRVAGELDALDSVRILVGGLPEIREWPYEYKAGFSPRDVIEEYVRPARYVANGELVTMPALSEPELVDVPGIGTLEAFNTDGLRTLLRTVEAPNMIEKTLRYPGHIEKIAVLRETGFFGKEPVDVGGVEVRPLDLTAELLFPKWKLLPGDRDITVLQVVVEGRKAGRRTRHAFDMMDRFDPETGTHSMARTTGYTATLTLRLLAGGRYRSEGISPPEFIGRDPSCVRFILDGQRERGIVYRETVTALD